MFSYLGIFGERIPVEFIGVSTIHEARRNVRAYNRESVIGFISGIEDEYGNYYSV